jgi:hypothetical protein
MQIVLYRNKKRGEKDGNQICMFRLQKKNEYFWLAGDK